MSDDLRRTIPHEQDLLRWERDQLAADLERVTAEREAYREKLWGIVARSERPTLEERNNCRYAHPGADIICTYCCRPKRNHIGVHVPVAWVDLTWEEYEALDTPEPSS